MTCIIDLITCYKLLSLLFFFDSLFAFVLLVRWWAPSKFDPVKSPMLFFDKGLPVVPPLSPDAGLDMVLEHMVCEFFHLATSILTWMLLEVCCQEQTLTARIHLYRLFYCLYTCLMSEILHMELDLNS